jgi:hypothetical protein
VPLEDGCSLATRCSWNHPHSVAGRAFFANYRSRRSVLGFEDDDKPGRFGFMRCQLGEILIAPIGQIYMAALHLTSGRRSVFGISSHCLSSRQRKPIRAMSSGVRAVGSVSCSADEPSQFIFAVAAGVCCGCSNIILSEASIALRRFKAAVGLHRSRPLVMNLVSTLPSDTAFKMRAANSIWTAPPITP